MKRRLLVSFMAVAGLGFTSILAFANSFDKTVIHTLPELDEQYVQAADPLYIEQFPDEEIEPVWISADEADTSRDEVNISSMDWDANESYMLAKIAMAEAEGEDTYGKALVILVVLNRVWSEEFPDTIEEVIMQDGQFSPVSDGGRYWTTEPNEDCWKALDLVMVDKWNGSNGALYFSTPSCSSWHRDNLEYLFTHGGHEFFTEREADND